MTAVELPDKQQEQRIGEALKGWIMALLTLIFVSLYAAALFGWMKPLTDITMIARVEPIIFIIVGYYFGRLPAQQNEKTLKQEISRQTQKADAAQYAKERVIQQKEVLEEKMRNAKTALTPDLFDVSSAASIENDSKTNLPINQESVRQSL